MLNKRKIVLLKLVDLGHHLILFLLKKMYARAIVIMIQINI